MWAGKKKIFRAEFESGKICNPSWLIFWVGFPLQLRDFHDVAPDICDLGLGRPFCCSSTDYFRWSVLAIKLIDYSGAILTKQRIESVGEARVFILFKFRTKCGRMPRQDKWGNLGLAGDPRITACGKIFYRTARLDEIPQLWWRS